jgi:hypothetical protein
MKTEAKYVRDLSNIVSKRISDREDARRKAAATPLTEYERVVRLLKRLDDDGPGIQTGMLVTLPRSFDQAVIALLVADGLKVTPYVSQSDEPLDDRDQSWWNVNLPVAKPPLPYGCQ